VVKAVLRSESVKNVGEINVIFVNDATIRRLNRKFLGESGPTDVIAFSYDRIPHLLDQPFGDIYISVDEAAENAERFGETEDRELVRLMVHGALHLLGYSDHKIRDREKMWRKQEKLVARFSPRPKPKGPNKKS